MAQVVVGFEDYRDGRLPGVCAISGVPTEDFVVVRTPVPGPGRQVAAEGGLAKRLDRFVDAIDVRRPQHTLVGRLPVSRAVWARRQKSLRMWKVATVGAVLALLASGWVGAPWSPYVSLGAAAAIGLGLFRRTAIRAELPKASAIHDQGQVVLQRVSDEFVAAVGNSSDSD